jgi:gliding motility-associated-like protein
MRRRSYFLLIVSLLVFRIVNAQLNVFPNGSATALANMIVGNNITISNPILNCGAGGAGTFTATSTNLGLTSGILLTTGTVANAIGPNNDAGNNDPNACINATANFFDNDISAIEPQANYDGCVLKFNITPICSTLNISYVFASEEYPEYVNANYNDAFGFFISGPNPAGGNYSGFNIAKLANGTPISIDNINSGSNAGFYVNNNGGPTIQYDGFTTPLIAAVNVVPCSTYTLKLAIADAGDCIYDSGVFLAFKGLTCPQAQIPNISASSTPVLCGNDGTASVTVTNFTGTPTYSWAPGGSTTPTITNLAPGTYTCTLSFLTPCPYTQTITATVAGTQVINSQMSSTPSTCNSPNGTATALVSGGTGPYTYSWSTNPAQTTATASGLIPGTYSVVIGDNNGCLVTQTVTVANFQPVLNLNDSIQNTTCGQSNGAIFISNVTGGNFPYSYSWNSGQTNDDITGVLAGTYTLTITDNLNCVWTFPFTVPDVVTLPVALSQVNEKCLQQNGSATVSVLNGVPPFTYVWSTNPVQTTPTATGLSQGIYSVTVTDAAGCSTTSIFSILNVDDVFGGSVVVDPTLPQAGENFQVTLNIGTGWTLIQSNWPDGSSGFTLSNLLNIPEYGSYSGSFWIVSDNNCVDTVEYTVFVKDSMTLYVPNAFTPNGDGINDIFKPSGTLVKTFNMLIFDRWGELIFETESFGRGWDGFYKGQKVQNDVYVWKIYATDFYDIEHILIGHVTVVR